MPPAAERFLPWGRAMEQALYGHGGFFHRPEGPAGHFRTSVHASPLFAAALARLLADVDALLGHPATLDVVDVGAGRGELLTGLRTALAEDPVRTRVRLTGVELAVRPDDLPADIRWVADLPDQVVGLVLANEWLDDVPVDVVEVGPDGPVRVLVEPSTGQETPGGPLGVQDTDWLTRWWPLDDAAPGARAEVGLQRDRAWAAAVGALTRGVALAVDYGHVRDDRAAGSYAAGTLTGYRDGRVVAPIPDGTCDLTAHVAVDACALAGRSAGALATALLTQREALTALGVSASLPDVAEATREPGAYARALSAAGQAGELLDAGGLGGFWWLAQSVDVGLPAVLDSGGPGRR